MSGKAGGIAPRYSIAGSSSYADLSLHQRIALVIRDHSENKQDIREVANAQVEWENVRSLLDLGCGYGWLEQSLTTHLDFVAGVDACGENRQAFLREARRISERVAFIECELPARLDLPSGAFDLVAACYSLYFFPGMLPEVHRLLAPSGTFLAITHSEEMLAEGEAFFEFNNLRGLIKRFSSENGEDQLRWYFWDVRTIDFPNCLVFCRDGRDDLAAYVQFKKEFIQLDAEPELVQERLLDELDKRGELRFNKNDRIFVVRK